MIYYHLLNRFFSLTTSKLEQHITFILLFRRRYQESEPIHAIHKEDKSLKSGMTVAMTQVFESKFKMLLEAGAFRSLCMHLAERSDAVQNIDLMTVAGFCRNCLAKVSSSRFDSLHFFTLFISLCFYVATAFYTTILHNTLHIIFILLLLSFSFLFL